MNRRQFMKATGLTALGFFGWISKFIPNGIMAEDILRGVDGPPTATWATLPQPGRVVRWRTMTVCRILPGHEDRLIKILPAIA